MNAIDLFYNIDEIIMQLIVILLFVEDLNVTKDLTRKLLFIQLIFVLLYSSFILLHLIFVLMHIIIGHTHSWLYTHYSSSYN